MSKGRILAESQLLFGRILERKKLRENLEKFFAAFVLKISYKQRAEQS